MARDHDKAEGGYFDAFVREGGLAGDILKLGGWMLAVQLRANRTEERAAFPIAEDQQDIALRAAEMQQTMRAMARHHLDVCIPQISGLMTRSISAANMIVALETGMRADPLQANPEALLNKIANTFASYAKATHALARAASRNSSIAATATHSLTGEIGVALHRCEGGDGPMTTLQRRIELTDDTIQIEIESALADPRLVFEDPERLVHFMPLLAAAETPNAAAFRIEHFIADGGAPRAIDTSVISVCRRLRRMQADNRALAALNLSVARASQVCNEGVAMAEAIHGLDQSLLDLATRLDAMAGSYRKLARRAGRPDTRPQVRAALTGARRQWTRISSLTGQIVAFLSSLDAFLPARAD